MRNLSFTRRYSMGTLYTHSSLFYEGHSRRSPIDRTDADVWGTEMIDLKLWD